MATNHLIIQVDRAIEHLHPEMIAITRRLLKTLADAYEARETHCRFELFEGFRHPVRQHHLLTETRTTKAGMWESAHQYGLAIDIVPRARRTSSGVILNGWSWEATNKDWAFMRHEARRAGLRAPIEWDKPHLEHPRFLDVRAALKG